MDTIKILIANENSMLSESLRLRLNSQPDLEVLGEVNNTAAAINLVTERNPDIVLLNMNLSESDMVHTIKQIQRIQPSIRVLIFTNREEGVYIRTALKAGASGYVCLGATDSELDTAIRAIHKGRLFVDLCSDEGLRQVLTNKSGKKKENHWCTEHLSEREKSVLTLVARGHTNQEIAKRLAISIKSVESYRARLMDKLNCQNRADLVQFAIDGGLFESEGNSLESL